MPVTKRKTTKSENKEKVDKETTNKPKANEKKKVTLFGSCFRVLKYAIVILLIPPFLNYAALQHEVRFIKLPGIQYDVRQGQKLHLYCRGKGSPTVILEAPTATSSDIWHRIQREISKVTTVCSYDRAGIGFSERPFTTLNRTEEKEEWKRNEQFTVERMATDLHQLLTASSQQPKPFILVGAGLGASVARFYAQMFEEEVAALILISPLSEELVNEKSWNDYWITKVLFKQRMRQISAATGLSRLGLLLNIMKLPEAPANIDMERRYKHLLCQPRHLASGSDEIANFNISMSQVDSVFKIKPFSSKILVTFLEGEPFDGELSEVHKKCVEKMILRHRNATRIPVKTNDVIGNSPGLIVKYVNAAVEYAKKTKTVSSTNFVQS